jgi:hypothetical protein
MPFCFAGDMAQPDTINIAKAPIDIKHPASVLLISTFLWVFTIKIPTAV